MTRPRKIAATAVALATLGSAAFFAPTSAANAGGYYTPGNGYYGKPYYPPSYTYHAPRCHWEKYRHRDPYSYGWVWSRRWVCN